MQGFKLSTDSGEMRIKLEQEKWHLDIFGQPVGTYRSPSAAAWDVADHRTGYDKWDQKKEEDAPSTINGWQVY